MVRKPQTLGPGEPGLDGMQPVSQHSAVRRAKAPLGQASAQRRPDLRKPSTSGRSNGTPILTLKPRPIIARPSASPSVAAIRTQTLQLMHLPGS